MKSRRGAGSIYRPKGSRNVWLKYYRDGVAVRESSGTDSEREAQRLLNQRVGEIASGNYIEPSNRKVTIDQLYQSLLDHYRINDVGSLDATEARWQRQPLLGEEMPEPGRLKKRFSGMKAIALNRAKIDSYILWCQKEQGISNATINRDLAALRRAYKLAQEAEVIQKVPRFPILKEAPPRQGFFEYSDYIKLLAHAHELWLRAILVCCYDLGVRKGELVGDFRYKPPFADGLRVRHVDLLARTIQLTETKNGDDRTVPMTQDIYPLMVACCQGKSPSDWVFTHSDGTQVKDFRKRWARLKRDAGVNADLLIHDNRRSAVRNMIRSGVPDLVAMKISGHKTRSVFDRYNIVNDADLKQAVVKMDAAKAANEVWAQNGHSFEKSTATPDKPERLN